MFAFLLKESPDSRPHITGAVIDSTESGELDLLRSEVDTAIELLGYQLRRGDFRDHYIIPVGTLMTPAVTVLTDLTIFSPS